jgi:putative addiction module killer protein
LEFGYDEDTDRFHQRFRQVVGSGDVEGTLQIRKRLLLIEQEGHFGDFKYVDDHLFELRWQNGRRIYFAKLSGKKILLLIGGRKNAQEKEIKKAKALIKRLSLSDS